MINNLERDVNRTILLLNGLFEYVNDYYHKNGLQSLINITDPSLDDLLEILTEIDKVLPLSNENAKQAVLLAFGLINSLKCANIDDIGFKAQIKTIINTAIHQQ